MNRRQPRGTQFYAEDIFALLELDPNERYVPIARLCERLGLPLRTYEQRARASAALGEGLRLLEVEQDDGSTTRQLCLRIDLLPLWLSMVEATKVDPALRPRLELFQREAASTLWQSFRPQGFGPEDTLMPERHEQNPAEQAYVAALSMATLARHQVLIERTLDARASSAANLRDPYAASDTLDDPNAELLARAVRRVALAAQERTRRNEYPGMYTGIYRQFSIASYRRTPPARLREALEWLERWRGDLMGEPEPPPDI
ncbi:MAG: hypothetical protein Fur005_15350 [Roseiflexaceae bacterium]